MDAAGHIHDKSDGAVGKHLVRCQLSRSFFPACGLETPQKLDTNHKETKQKNGAGEKKHVGTYHIHVRPRRASIQ
jgi:hypothetical protein